MKTVLLLCFVFFTNSLTVAQTLFPSSDGITLQSELKNAYYPTSVYNYNRARDTLYARIDNIADSIECVYTGFKIGYLRSEGDASTIAFNKGINAEHTWPQSFYNSGSPMVSDLHQLFPVWDVANSTRNDNPFAEIDDSLPSEWLYKGNKDKIKPDSSMIALYAQYYKSTFESRESHKGNAARAIFYFWTMYQKENAITSDATDNATWFNNMKAMLYQWHKQDPADQREIDRSNLIATFQGKQNPFVHDSSLVFRAYFQGVTSEPSEPSIESEPTNNVVYKNQIIISQYYEGLSNNKWIEVANVGQFDFDFSKTPLYLQLYSNPTGDRTGISPSQSYTFTGTLKADSVLLFKNTNSALPVHGKATASTSVCTFNGNDVVILSTSTGSTAWANRTDVFGLNDGNDFAKDVCYVRKPNSIKGVTTWNQSEWEIIDLTTIDNLAESTNTNYLGKHISDNAVVISGTQGWRMLAFPVTNLSLSSSFSYLWTQGASGSNSPTSKPNLFTFNEITNQFQAVTDLESPSGIGTGYAFYVFADDDFDGQSDLFPKVITYKDENTNLANFSFSATYQNQGWNLLGNPYPFAIDWNSSEWVKTNLNNTIYIYDNDLEDYKAWNGVTGTNGMLNGIIPAFQSFFVQANNPSPILSVTSEAKSTTTAIYKSNQSQEIRVNYRNQDAVIVFIDGASSDIDSFDAFAPPNISGKRPLLLRKDDSNFIIASLPTDLESPITFEIPTISNPDSLKITNTSNFDSILEVISGAVQITVKPKTTITSVESNFTDKPSDILIHPAFPNPFNPSTAIQIELNQATRFDISVFNAIGQTVKSYSNLHYAKGTNTFTFDASTLPTGVYFIQFKSNKSNSLVKVVLIK